MKLNLKCIYARIAIVGISTMFLAALSYAAGLRINTTKSIPVGLYLVIDAPVKKGAYVLFCPPDISIFSVARERNYIARGFCPGHYSYMMKKILAAKNDLVTVTDDGVFINGAMLPYSKPIKTDPSGRKLPRYRPSQYTFGRSELLLMSDVSHTSFDGRYFGPIDRAQVKSVIHPLFTW